MAFLTTTILIMSFLTLPSAHGLIHPKASPTIIAAAPAMLPYPPQVSPDIEPLFPSPASSGSSSMPTIPSTRSPPNPDATTNAIGPDAAVAPSGLLRDSSAEALARRLGVGGFCGCLAYWILVMF